MREYFRPYNKVIDITDTNQHVVLLTDTGGSLLDCNYVAVSNVSGGDVAGTEMFQVVPSGINTLYGGNHVSGGSYDTWGSLSGRDRGPSGYNNANARTSNSASGTLGLAGAQSDSLIISLGGADTTTAIIITQSGGDDTRYAVTYGLVNESNSRLDIARPWKEYTVE